MSLAVGPQETRCTADCSPINNGLYFHYLNHPNVARPQPLKAGETEFEWEIAVDGKGSSRFKAIVIDCGKAYYPNCKGVDLVNGSKERHRTLSLTPRSGDRPRTAPTRALRCDAKVVPSAPLDATHSDAIV